MKYMNPIQQSRDIVQEFRGYNHNLRISEGEWYDEENMSSDYYPVTSARKKREKLTDGTAAISGANGAITLGNTLFYTKGKALYTRDLTSSIFDFSAYSTIHDLVPRQLVQTGAYIVIFPDGVYYNTIDSNDNGSINNMWAASGNVTFTLSDIDGWNEYSGAISSDTPPVNPQDGDYWIDTTDPAKPSLKQYSSGEWVAITNTYIKISAANIAKGYAVGDGVTISGIDLSKLAFLNDTMVLQTVYHDSVNDGSGDFIVVIGIMDALSYIEYDSAMQMERKAPTMDFVVEANNRLWGCHYGNNDSGDLVNELYACKLGDFKNWNVFDGLSTDSYIASIGTYGPFTGAITYLGFPLFFKENCLHKVYGSIPASFQVNTVTCDGVARGAGNSLAIIDGRLYYKSVNGVCVYDGSLPSDISAALGKEIINFVLVNNEQGEPSGWWKTYSELRWGVSGGSFDGCYFISCKEKTRNKYVIVTYDTRRGIWHKEEPLKETTTLAGDYPVLQFVTTSQGLYAVERWPGYIYCITDEVDSSAEWWAESGDIGLLLPDKQYISKLTLTLSAVIGAEMSIAIQYDGSGDWEHVTTVYGNGMQHVTQTIRPRRCTFFRLRIFGKGDAKLYGYTKTIEAGSDV